MSSGFGDIQFNHTNPANDLGGQRMFFRKAPNSICVLLLAAILGGCGGSTQGTGGVTVEGRLLEISGAPVNGALVTVVTSGDSATTDANGAFVVGAEGEQIELLFESGNTSAATAVQVTPNTRKVVATFKLDRARGRVETEDLEIEEDDDGRDDDPIEDDSDDDNGGDDDSADDGDDSSDDDDGGDSDGENEDDSPDEDREDGEDSDGDGSGSGSSGGGEDIRREVRGTLEVISSVEVVVDGIRFAVLSTTEYRDENGVAVSAGYFSIGLEVKARGVERSGLLILERLEAED